MNITICGGGNLGHVCAGFLAAQNNKVSILTSSPERWGEYIDIADCYGKKFHSPLAKVSALPSEVIPQADLVLVCLPGYAIPAVLSSIRSILPPSAIVGTVVSSTGFFFEAMKTLLPSQPLFGFQRVPFIARTIEYGHRAELKGYKESLSVAIEHSSHKEEIRSTLEQLFKTPVKLLGSYYEASLSNSNPLLHPARLYSLWKDWKPGMVYDSIPLFYEEWTDEASRLYLEMDHELQSLLQALPVRPGSIPTVLDYYECIDAATLTNKLRSIEAFKCIAAPMKPAVGGYAPDLQSRYFTEDFPFGLAIVRRLAHEKGVTVPTIDHICEWGMAQTTHQ